MRTLLLPSLLLLSCGDKEEEDDTGGTTTCGSMHGFVYGNVTGKFGGPDGEARVYAVSEVLDWEEGEVAADGSYELNLLGGLTWTIYALDEDECASIEHELLVEECTEYALDLDVIDCITADKPNLYLYPLDDTPTSVRLFTSPSQRVIASDPLYPRQGWQGIAHPDGSFSVGARRAPFLFYEVSLAPWQEQRMQRQQGFCLPEEGAVEAMAELLGEYGFNAVEREDFIEGWEHDLPPGHEGYTVYPQLRVEPYTAVEIQPAMPLSRLWLLVEDGAGCTASPPVIRPFSREGAHAVEWGLIFDGVAR